MTDSDIRPTPMSRQAAWLWTAPEAQAVLATRVGSTLRTHRRMRGQIQTATGDLLGYDKTYVSAIELGKRRVTDVASLRHIAERNGVPPHVLDIADTDFRAMFLSRAATAQMRAGDADAGAATGHEVLTLVDGIQSARLDDHLRTMLGEARQVTGAKPLRTLLERGDTLLKERAAA
ncbi:helix-turn-helix domain-containing protein [Streptomyces californicus]|uniref:helix-turn-helix domain-containing protein n=1 Tax=Streptomyces californicus TaxID=67351 RepID=UPI00371ED3DE